MDRKSKAIIAVACMLAVLALCCGCTKASQAITAGEGSQTISFTNCMHAEISKIAVKSYSDKSYSSSNTYDVSVAVGERLELKYNKVSASTVNASATLKFDSEGTLIDDVTTTSSSKNKNEAAVANTYSYSVKLQEVVYDIKVTLQDGREYEMHKVALDDIAKNPNITLLEEDGYVFFSYIPEGSSSSVSGLYDQKAFANGEMSETELENSLAQTAKTEAVAIATGQKTAEQQSEEAASAAASATAEAATTNTSNSSGYVSASGSTNSSTDSSDYSYSYSWTTDDSDSSSSYDGSTSSDSSSGGDSSADTSDGSSGAEASGADSSGGLSDADTSGDSSSWHD